MHRPNRRWIIPEIRIKGDCEPLINILRGGGGGTHLLGDVLEAIQSYAKGWARRWRIGTGGEGHYWRHVKRERNKVPDALCNWAMDRGGGEWSSEEGLQALLGSIQGGSLQWVGAAFDGGYRAEEGMGAVGFEVLFCSNNNITILGRYCARIRVGEFGSYEAETRACWNASRVLNELLVRVFSIEAAY